MAYADYMHCPGCDGKVIYTGDRDYEDESGHPSYGPAGVEAWHADCLGRRVSEMLTTERERYRVVLRRADALMTILRNALHANAHDSYEMPDDPGLADAIAAVIGDGNDTAAPFLA